MGGPQPRGQPSAIGLRLCAVPSGRQQALEALPLCSRPRGMQSETTAGEGEVSRELVPPQTSCPHSVLVGNGQLERHARVVASRFYQENRVTCNTLFLHLPSSFSTTSWQSSRPTAASVWMVARSPSVRLRHHAFNRSTNPGTTPLPAHTSPCTVLISVRRSSQGSAHMCINTCTWISVSTYIQIYPHLQTYIHVHI